MQVRRIVTLVGVCGILTCTLFFLLAGGVATTAPAADALLAAPHAAALAPAAATAAGPVLHLRIAPSNPQPAWGDVYTYTLVLSNTGDTAAGVIMTNTLPAGLNYLAGSLQSSADSAEYRAGSATIAWQGDLPPNAPVTLSYRAQLVTTEFIYNTALLHHPGSGAQASATSSPVDSWSAPETLIQAISFDQNLAGRRPLAVDSQNRARLAFASDQGIFYATFDDGAWNKVSVPVTPSMLSKTALALDMDDRASIAFYDGPGHIWLAQELDSADRAAGQVADGGWRLESVTPQDFGSNTSERIDLRFGSDGRLHAIYYDADDHSYHHLVRDGAVWSAPTTAVDSSTCSPLALDQGNVPHLACVKDRQLRLYTYTGVTPWTSYTVVAQSAGSADAIYAPSLTYVNSEAHVAFMRPNNGLYHATYAGGWIVTQVDQSPWDAQITNAPVATAIDARGGQLAIGYGLNVRVTGSSIYTETIRLATRPVTGTAWLTESVDSVADFSWSQAWAQPALALTDDGHAHLAYYHLTDATLRHAEQTNSFTYHTVAESRTLGPATAVDVGSDGSIHAVYLASGLRYTMRYSNTAVWSPALVAAGVDENAAVGLALDAANTPHIVYQDAGAPPYHVTRSGAGWMTQPIDAQGSSSPPAIAAGAAGEAHVAYVGLEPGSQVLRYGALTGAGWATTTLATVGPIAWDLRPAPKVAIQGDRVHVLYADCAAYRADSDYPITVTLKTRNGDIWSTQMLHTFTGRCNERLDARLVDDGMDRVAALIFIADAVGALTQHTFWIETSATGALLVRAAAVQVLPAQPQAARTAQGVSGSYTAYLQTLVRGPGQEQLSAGNGAKQAVYTDESGASSDPTTVAATLDQSTMLRSAASYGGYGAVLEYSNYQDVLAVETRQPRPRPAHFANATKSATPAAVYAYERITYTIRLTWQGNAEAAIVIQDEIEPPRVITDTIQPKVVYVDGTLRWGPYVSQCSYDIMSNQITCAGMFPASATPLETTVTFAVEVRCRAYEDGSYENVAQVGIGGYYFTPAARTALEAPFQLRASTPQFVPMQHFAPVQTALLYTVPKGDEPAALLDNCQFDVYSRLTLAQGSGLPQLMRNDGQNPDFHAQDVHHSAWVNLANGEPYFYDHYVVAAGFPFRDAVHGEQFRISNVAPPMGPELAVLTDFQAMFDEWGYIGQHYPAEQQDASIKDRDGNRILDFYDAVERIRQYAEHENGVVIDVARDAYDETTRDLGFYSTFANRLNMGNQIDALVAALPRTVKNVAIVGNDAVVPYARVGVAAGAYNEVRPATELLGIPYSETGYDRYNRTLSQLGAWLSDIPYGTWSVARPALPRLNLGVGRVFRDLPLDLLTLFDRLEGPLPVGRDSRAWVLNSPQLKQTYESFQATHYDYSQEAESSVVPTLRRYLRTVTRLDVHPAQTTTPYGPGAYWLDGDMLLRPNGTPWHAADVGTIKNQADLLVFVAPGGESGMQTGGWLPVNRAVLEGGSFALALAAGNHAGILPAGRDAEQWRTAWFGNAVTDANAGLMAPTARTVRIANLAGFLTSLGYPYMFTQFLDNLYYDWHQTVGQAQVYAHNYYAATTDSALENTGAFNSQTLYTILLNGLPTQRLERTGSAAAAVTQLAAHPATSRTGDQARSFTVNRTVSLPYFEPITDGDGRVAFAIPHNGYLNGEPYGPLLPVVQHSYILPADAADIAVTLTGQQSHTRGPLTPIPLTPVDDAGRPLTNTLTVTLTNPYPAQILSFAVYTESTRTYLDVFLVAQQYNPVTQQATLFDRLDYQLAYSAPETYVVSAISVGAGARSRDAALPIVVTVDAAQPFSGTLYWAIQDQAGRLFDAGQAPLQLAGGIHQVELTSDATGWEPGPKQFIVLLATDQGSGETAVAGGHALFTVSGRSLTLATDAVAYAQGEVAALTAAVRDESGAPVAASLATQLDGAALALTWQGSGLYSATLDLSGVVTGQHFIAVTVDDLVAVRGFVVTAAAQDSTIYLPAIQRSDESGASSADTPSATAGPVEAPPTAEQRTYLPLIGRQEE